MHTAMLIKPSAYDFTALAILEYAALEEEKAPVAAELPIPLKNGNETLSIVKPPCWFHWYNAS